MSSKLFSTISSLTKRETKIFKTYLLWKYFNPNENVVKTYQVLETWIEKKQEPSKEHIFKNIFPDEKYDDKKVRYLLTDLYRLLQKFLVIHSVEEDSLIGQSILRKELAKRGCDKAYRTELLKRETEEPDVKDAEFFYHEYLAEHHHLQHYLSRQNRKEKINLEKIATNLDVFYVARKLQLGCEIHNFKNVMASDFKNFLQDEIIQSLTEQTFLQIPVIKIYYSILKTLTESEKEEHFEMLRQTAVAYESQFGISELRDIYQYIFNYCIKKINQGEVKYQRILFEIYQVTLTNKVLLENEQLSQWNYKNIVTLSLRLQEYAWSKQFIDKYEEYLPETVRENAHKYNIANWHFHKQEFSVALKLLQQVDFTDIFYQLDTRSILLKIYFELDEIETLLYHANAFKTYLKRNKMISDYQRTIYKNLLKYTLKIIHSQTNKTKLKTLSREIDSTRQIADLQWLKQKVADLV